MGDGAPLVGQGGVAVMPSQGGCVMGSLHVVLTVSPAYLNEWRGLLALLFGQGSCSCELWPKVRCEISGTGVLTSGVGREDGVGEREK